MKLKTIGQLVSLRDVRKGLLGFFVVLIGFAMAGLTLWANRIGNFQLATYSAVASLGFVLIILIFVVPPLARSASSEASRMNLPFEFTTGGAFFLVLLIIVGFAAANTGNNLLFIILAFLTSSFIVGFVAGNIGLKKMNIKIRFPETVFAGEPTPLMVSLENDKKFFSAHSITTEVRGTRRIKSIYFQELSELLSVKIAKRITQPLLVKQTLDYFVFVPRNKTIESNTNHIFLTRGRFIIKDFELSTRFPFGFFRHRRRLSAIEAEVVIFPKIHPYNSRMIHERIITGNQSLAKKGSGQDLLSMREYQPLDDLRHVDWKATARAGKMIVRDFASDGENKIYVYFDTKTRRIDTKQAKTIREKLDEENGKFTTEDARNFENRVSFAASLLVFFANEQSEIRLTIDDEFGEFGIGKIHLNECLKRLALIDPTYVDHHANDFTNDILEDLAATSQDSHTFFFTDRNEIDLPDLIVEKTQIVKNFDLQI